MIVLCYAFSVSLMKPFKAELENLRRVKDYDNIHSSTWVGRDCYGQAKTNVGPPQDDKIIQD